MSDLRSQLQSALGNAYILERELGGGGMSRVFVATDVSLDRKVVVKVLPEEMVGHVSLERFRREIALAARLQHPHVVPLLTAGDADGLPYFTMPLVEGESLRARIARHGELPLSEAIRLLREIASALSYAHEHGIVHRDIKPDNVLLSGGGAMITDFGVAKAISASSNAEGGTATSMGVALGTPAYMSPEQASADPGVDHRADIYAFGVLAYELLTGQPPFVGRSPQGLLAAHVTESPEPVTRRRPSIPPSLGALVMRCLEKRASDRPQRAADLVNALDQITTPSGGSMPTSAVPATSLAVTDAVSRRSNRARWIGIAATVIVVVVAGVLAMTRRAGATTPRSIAVMPTEMGGDTAHAYLADGLSGDLTTRLSRIPGLVVRAYSSSKAMRGKAIGEAGKALQVSSILTASMARSGNRLRVTASLIDPANESVQWSDTFEANDQDQFALQDRLVNAIADALRLTLSAATVAKVEARGTHSAEAHDLVQRSRFQSDQFTAASLRSAVSLAELAIQKDSTYADAWAALSQAWGLLADDFISPREALPHIRPAVQRALELDPNSAEAHAQAGVLHYFYDWDLAAARREFETALALDSANATAGHFLSDVLAYYSTEADLAFKIRERALRLNPGSPSLLRFAGDTRWMRRLSDAERDARCKAILIVAPESAPSCESARLLLSGDTVAARALARSTYSAPPAGANASLRLGYADAMLAYGDTTRARQEIATVVAMSAHEHVREDAIALFYYRLGDVDRSIEWWRRAVDSNGALVIELAKAPEFARLRKDPRVQALLVKAGIK
jgi:eukaryotic-like serine/threonine-protein kinase